MSKAIDRFFETPGQWQVCFIALRQVLKGYDLQEALYKEMPCYKHNNKKVILLYENEYTCGLLTFRFLKTVTQGPSSYEEVREFPRPARPISYKSVQDIRRDEPYIMKYIAEAIDLATRPRVSWLPITDL